METRHSGSLPPLVDGCATTVREQVLYGTFGQGVCVSDGEWTLFKSPVEDAPLFSCFTMVVQPLIVDNPIDGRVGAMPAEPLGHGKFAPTVPCPLWKNPIRTDPRTDENFPFNRGTDPDQHENFWGSAPEQRRRMLGILRAAMDEEGHPPEQLERLGLDSIAAAA